METSKTLKRNLSLSQITRKLNRKVTLSEKKEIDLINYTNALTRKIYFETVIGTNTTDPVYQTKRGEREGEYGYYMSGFIRDLYVIMNRLKLTKLLDLGSGPMIGLMPLHNRGIICKGFEIEDNFINLANRLLYYNSCVKKDILKITKSDIKDYEVIFFYEPFCSKKLSKQFIQNLSKIVSKEQIIVYNQANFDNYLDECQNFAKIKCNYPLKIYLVTK